MVPRTYQVNNPDNTAVPATTQLKHRRWTQAAGRNNSADNRNNSADNHNADTADEWTNDEWDVKEDEVQRSPTTPLLSTDSPR